MDILMPSILLGFGAVAASFYRLLGRKKALRAAAEELGLRPEEGQLPLGLQDFALIKHGGSLKASNIAWSEKRDFVVFDYSYTVQAGKVISAVAQTVGAFHCPGRGMPGFSARPEGLSDKVAAAMFGGQDIDFDSSPEFSKAYRVQGEDEAAIRDFFSVGGTQYLAARPGWVVEAKGDWLIAYRPGKWVLGAAALKEFVWDAQGLYGALLGL